MPHMHSVDDWHDFVRVGVFLLSLWCCYTLVVRNLQNNAVWNVKTKDYWYSMFMWCVVGVVTSIQGIMLDRPVTPAMVVIISAVLVTAKGLHKKGSWGGFDA